MSEIVAEGVANPDVPETLIDVFLPLVSESKIHFNDDGINIRAVDPANIAMAWADLSQEAFESWDAPGAATIGVNLEALDDRIGKAQSDSVMLSVDMERRYLTVGTERADMEMALIDPEAIRSEPDLPDLELPNTITLSREQLAYAHDVAAMSSDHIEVTGNAQESKVQFIGEGDTDANTVTYNVDEMADAPEIAEDATSLYSAEYFGNLVAGIPKNTDVTIRFGDEFPIHMEWTAVEDCLDVTMMLAPRIRSN